VLGRRRPRSPAAGGLGLERRHGPGGGAGAAAGPELGPPQGAAAALVAGEPPGPGSPSGLALDQQPLAARQRRRSGGQPGPAGAAAGQLPPAAVGCGAALLPERPGLPGPRRRPGEALGGGAPLERRQQPGERPDCHGGGPEPAELARTGLRQPGSEHPRLGAAAGSLRTAGGIAVAPPQV